MTLLAVGSYTAHSGGRGAGVTLLRRGSGVFVPAGSCELPSPSFVCWHPRLPVLYATGELDDGTVTALRVEGGLTRLATLPSGGPLPCHLSVTPDGRFLLCANYGGGVSMFALTPSGDLDRLVGAVPGTHAHLAVAHGAFVHVVDLGEDAIRSYRPDLTPVGSCDLPPGTGPRHLAVRGDRAYLVGELDSTVHVLALDPLPRLLASRPATAQPPAVRNYPAHVALSAGRLYVSNRGADCVTAFGVARDGALGAARDLAGVGAWPRHFAVLGETLLVAAERSDELVVLDGDARSTYPIGSPTCVARR